MSIADKLTTIAENVPKVYEAGKQAEYDAFWDSFQVGGERTAYPYGFYGWYDVAFQPKYPIKPTLATSMFSDSKIIGDITKRANIDFSACRGMMNAFSYSAQITRIGVVDCRAVTQDHIAFCQYCTSLETIDEIILKDDGTQYNSTSSGTWSFMQCTALKNVKITGRTGNWNINFQHSPLTKESITSIVNALWEGASGKTLTLKKTAKEAAFTDAEWSALKATKPNWNITLA